MLVELSTNPAGYLRAAFRFSEPRSISEAFGVYVFITLYSRVACGVIRLLGAIRVVVVGDPPENETLRRGRRLAATAVPAG